jgi:hypothetical protein
MSLGKEGRAWSKKEVSITLWSEAEKLSEIQANFISYDKQSLMLLFYECSKTLAKIFENFIKLRHLNLVALWLWVCVCTHMKLVFKQILIQ